MSASWVTREAAFRGKLEDGQSQGGFQSKVEALAWVVLATPGAAGERARAMVSGALPKPEAKSKDDAEGKGNAGKAEDKENKAKGKDAGGDESEGREQRCCGAVRALSDIASVPPGLASEPRPSPLLHVGPDSVIRKGNSGSLHG